MKFSVLLFLYLSSVVSVNLVYAGDDLVNSQESLVIRACDNKKYITIEALNAACGVPGTCYRKMECEGNFALVAGFISSVNIIDKREFPWMEHGKFFLYNNEDHDLFIEVMVDSDAADLIFDQLKEQSRRRNVPVYVKGLLVGADLQTMQMCQRELSMYLVDAGSLSFGSGVDKP